VGDENIFIFGLTSDEVAALRPNYVPSDYYSSNPLLKRTIDLVKSNYFNPDSPGLFDPIVDSLLSRDDYMVLADFAAYHDAQLRIEQAFRDPDGWTRMAIMNVARSGKFSSDRTIREYNNEIWHSLPVSVEGNVESRDA